MFTAIARIRPDVVKALIGGVGAATTHSPLKHPEDAPLVVKLRDGLV